MLLADRKELWPRLEKLGEKTVREMLVENQFEAHEKEEVQEWLTCQAAVGAFKEARFAKWASIIGAIAAVIAAIASMCELFK